MHDHGLHEDDSGGDWDAERQTKALAGLAFVLALAILGIYLVIHLQKIGRIEDCLLARHTNCDMLLSGASLRGAGLGHGS